MKSLISLLIVILLTGCSKNNQSPSLNGNWQFSITSPDNVSGEFSISNMKVTSGNFTIIGIKTVIDSTSVVGVDIDLLAKHTDPVYNKLYDDHIHLKNIGHSLDYSTITSDSIEYMLFFKNPGPTLVNGGLKQSITIHRK